MTTYAFPFDTVDMPGELNPPADDVLDFTPNIGGCGQALVVAAMVLTGKADTALDHLDGCSACREALARVSDVERSASALAFFTRADMEMPHATAGKHAA